MSRSVPSSPGDRKGQQGSIPIVGSAESLVGRVCINQLLKCNAYSSLNITPQTSLFQLILLQFKIAYLEFITKRTSCTGVWRIFQLIHKTVPTENFQSHSLFWLEQFWVIFSNFLPAGIIHFIFIGMIKILPTHLCWVWITKIHPTES